MGLLSSGRERLVKMRFQIGDKKIHPIILGFFVFFLISSKGFSSVRFEISVDKDVISLGEYAQLSLSFSGAQNIPAPKIEIKDFKVNYLGPSTQISIINGRISSSITHIYTIFPLKTGKFKIGPFTVNYKGQNLTSNSLEVEVVSGPSPSFSKNKSKVSEDYSQDLEDRIFLVVELAKRKVFVNELIPVRVFLFIDNLAVRDIEYPVLLAEGFSIKKFSKPHQYKKSLGGRVYDVIEFETFIYPLKEGELEISAKLNCNLVIRKKRRLGSFPFEDFFNEDFFSDFFSFYQTHPSELKSAEVPVKVLPPPQAKPQDFKGAVGDFSLEVEVSPLKVKVGDPVTLTMKVEGKGNFDSVNCPVLKETKGFKVYEPEVIQQERRKVFKQVLIPESSQVTEVPPVRFSFLNPETGKYETLTKGPFPLKVIAQPQPKTKVFAPVISEEAPQELGKDIVYIKSSLGKLRKRGKFIYKKSFFWIFNLLALIVFLGLSFFYKHKERLKNDQDYARKFSASLQGKRIVKELEGLLNQAGSKEFFDRVFREFSKYLSDKFNIPQGEVSLDKIKIIFENKNLDKEILEKIKNIFQTSEIVRFSSQEVNLEKKKEVLRYLKDIVTYLERKKL